MKKKLLMLLGIVFFCVNLYSQTLTDFEVIDPDLSNPQHEILTGVSGKLCHVANASFQLTSRHDFYTINAFVYNDLDGEMHLHVYVLDSFSNVISSGKIPVDTLAYFPDVIIRDEINNLGQAWIVSVVYNVHDCPDNFIVLQDFLIEDPLNIDISPYGYLVVGDGIYPKIDGFMDHTIEVDSELYAMRDFAVVYNDMSATDNVVLVHFDENASMINSDIMPDFIGFAPDVASITNLQQGGARYTYVVDYSYTSLGGGYMHLFLYDLTSMTLISHEVSIYPSWIPFYRIDAHSLIEDFMHMNRYIISGTHDCNDHYFMVDYLHNPFWVPTPGHTTIFPLFDPLLVMKPNGGHSVAAGMGFETYVPNNFPHSWLLNINSINRYEFTTLHSYVNGADDVSTLLMSNYLRNTNFGSLLIKDIFKVNNSDYQYGAITYWGDKTICTSCSVHAEGGYTSYIPQCGHTDYSYFFNSSLATQPNLGDYTVACWIDDVTNNVWFKQTNRYGNQGVSLISHTSDTSKGNTDDHRNNHVYQVFPNPVRDRINIVAEQDIESVVIYNVWGQNIYQVSDIKSPKLELNVNKLLDNSGNFVVIEVIINGKKYYNKVIVDNK